MSIIKSATLENRAIPSLDNPAIASAVCLLGRLMIVAIFFISGIGKITAPTATMTYITSLGLPFPQIGLAIGSLVELVGATALVLGYRTRWVAAVLAIYCVATAILVHHHFLDPNQFLHFFKNVAMAGGLLQVVVFGAGRFSWDARSHFRLKSEER